MAIFWDHSTPYIANLFSFVFGSNDFSAFYKTGVGCRFLAVEKYQTEEAAMAPMSQEVPKESKEFKEEAEEKKLPQAVPPHHFECNQEWYPRKKVEESQKEFPWKVTWVISLNIKILD